ncbi:MAG: DUF2330 domain-containing protein [Actinomycetota bacterium]
MRRAASGVFLVLFLAMSSPVWACGGLVAPNGSVNLLRTSTLAGYHNGVEHYITSFEFVGGGAKFGSIVPLPARPKFVTRGGEWTLQRLAQEVQPPPPAPADGVVGQSAAGSAKVIEERRIDGLLITILRGGSRGVGKWAKEEGFSLPPDAPEVLHFYSQRSRYFMAARFIPDRARKKKLREGDGIPIHLRIPTDNPWVPLRILGLGKQQQELIDADVFLLNDIEPALLPKPASAGERGMSLERSEQASQALLNDLGSDKGMKWIQEEAGMWLTYLNLDIDAGDLTYDLAVDQTGNGQPSAEDAFGKRVDNSTQRDSSVWGWFVVPLVGATGVRLVRRRVMPRR